MPLQPNVVRSVDSETGILHTFATRLCQKTGDLYLVQRALEHRQITTTEIYAKVNDSSVRRAVSSL